MTDARMTVYKYPVPIADRFHIDMPERAQVLMVAMQDGSAYMWARVDLGMSLTRNDFALVGTGHEVPARADIHVGSFMMEGGALVFHVFKLRRS